jgi:DHA2 family multidrug resistance protein
MRLALSALACLISVFIDQSANGATSALTPYLSGSGHADADQSPWLTIIYFTVYFTSLIASPWMIARFTRRPVWAIGHATFALGAIGTALSSSSFIGMEFWQGVEALGQGTFFVCAVSTVLAIFPQKINFIGFMIFAATSLIGAAAGYAIGGAFVDWNAWTDFFVIYALLAIIAATIVSITVPNTTHVLPKPPYDIVGFALVAITMLCYNYLAQFGERSDWFTNGAIVGYGCTVVAGATAFIVWELWGTRQPFVNLRLFVTTPNLRYGSLLAFVLGVPLFGSTTYVQFFEQSLLFSPYVAGREFLLRAITIVAFVPFVAFALGRRIIDPRAIIIPGFVAVAISYVLQYQDSSTLARPETFDVSILFSGMGFAMLFSPIASSVINSLPQRYFTQGVAFFKLILVVSGSGVTALLAVLVDHRTALHRSDLIGAVGPGTANLAVFQYSGGTPSGLATLISGQSTALAYGDAALYTAVLVVIIAPLTFAIKPPK